MKFFLDSDWCAIILSRPCSSCYGNLAVVMVSLFSQLSVMTHSARSAPNIAYRCYLLNFEKPLGKLRSWERFQAFLCRLGAHQVVWLNPSSLSSLHSGRTLYVFPPPFQRGSSLNHTAAVLNRSHLCFYIIEMKITEPLPHQIHSMFYSASLSSGKGNDPSLKGNVLHFACSLCCFFRMWNQKHKIGFFIYLIFSPFKWAQVFQVLSLFQRQSCLGYGSALCE